jgi:A/G-specific adenine glycosylase
MKSVTRLTTKVEAKLDGKRTEKNSVEKASVEKNKATQQVATLKSCEAHDLSSLLTQQDWEHEFSSLVIAWQKQSGRHHLPWQQVGNAYRTWLSEIMLQQTQVSAVIPYFQRFIQRFPDLESLALAHQDEVMALWSGLGYYTRARNLHACAKRVYTEYQGCFPEDPALLEQLPGIGRSTAAAITAFSYGTRAAILDGNVKRVMARVFAVKAFPGIKKVEDALWQKVDSLLPQHDMTAYTQGLMDLGATVCTRSKPKCVLCPLQNHCAALALDLTEQLPVPKPKKVIAKKNSTMLLLRDGNKVLLEMRPNTGIWGGLYSLPEFDGMSLMTENSFDDTLQNSLVQQWLQQFGQLGEVQERSSFEHTFSHFKLFAQIVHVPIVSHHATIEESKYVWLDLANVEQAALPAPIKQVLLNLVI